MSLESITIQNNHVDACTSIGRKRSMILRESPVEPSAYNLGPNDTGGPVVLYSDIPYLTRIVRVVGHVAVTNSSRTKVYELRAWPYLSTNQSVWIQEGLQDITRPILFGRPKKYLPVAVPIGSEKQWDDALEECSEKWRSTVHLGLSNNCHSFVSDAMNLFHAKLGGTGTPHTFLSLMWDVRTRGVPIPRTQQPWSWIFDYKKQWVSVVETAIGLHKSVEPQCRRQLNKKNTQVVFPQQGRVAKPMAEVMYGKLQSPTEKQESVRRLQQLQALGFHVPEPQLSPSSVSLVCCCVPISVPCSGLGCDHCVGESMLQYRQDDDHHNHALAPAPATIAPIVPPTTTATTISPPQITSKQVRFERYPQSCPHKGVSSPHHVSSSSRRNSIQSIMSIQSIQSSYCAPTMGIAMHQVIPVHPNCPVHWRNTHQQSISQPHSPDDSLLPNLPQPARDDRTTMTVYSPNQFYQQERRRYSLDGPLTPPSYETLVNTVASTATERACRTGLKYIFSLTEQAQCMLKSIQSESIQNSIQNTVDQIVNIVVDEYENNRRRNEE